MLGLTATARSDDGALDVATLRVRLKDTSAIGPVTKLRLKSEIEDLVSDLAALHAGHATETLDGLHARYRDLVLRVIALLEQGDASLAHDLTVSTDHNLGDARRPRAVHLAGEELNSRPPSEGRARGVAHALPTKTRAPGCTQLHGPLDTAARARRRPGGRTASGVGIGFLGKGVKQKVIPLHLPPMSPTPTSAVAFCPVPIESGQYAPVAGRAWVGTTLT